MEDLTLECPLQDVTAVLDGLKVTKISGELTVRAEHMDLTEDLARDDRLKRLTLKDSLREYGALQGGSSTTIFSSPHDATTMA